MPSLPGLAVFGFDVYRDHVRKTRKRHFFFFFCEEDTGASCSEEAQCQAVGCFPPEMLVAEDIQLWLGCVGAVPTR